MPGPSPPVHRQGYRLGTVARPELVARLRHGQGARLVLVGAPAGWGKTTLPAEWRAAEAERTAVAWLSLDAADNDPVRFWTYVVEARRGATPAVDGAALAAVAVPGEDAAEGAVTMLVNQLATAPLPIALVLDDYHAVVDDRPRRNRGGS